MDKCMVVLKIQLLKIINRIFWKILKTLKIMQIFFKKNKKNKKNRNKNMFISEQKMKFDDNEILLINILLETHTMGTTAIT